MSRAHCIRMALAEAQAVLQRLMADESLLKNVELSGELLADVFRAGGRAFSCGNGGSMCDAIHFAEELSGKFRKNRPALPALAISDPGHISCVANDFGYECIFSRFLEAHSREGDVLLAITTSGNSGNILNAAKTARERGVRVIGMTGKQECRLAELSDILLATPAGSYSDRVQEMHIKLIHIMIELVERELFPENYGPAEQKHPSER